MHELIYVRNENFICSSILFKYMILLVNKFQLDLSLGLLGLNSARQILIGFDLRFATKLTNQLEHSSSARLGSFAILVKREGFSRWRHVGSREELSIAILACTVLINHD